MKQQKVMGSFILVLLSLLCAFAAGPPEKYTARLAPTTGEPVKTSPTRMTIKFHRMTTDSERESLIQVLKDKGARDLSLALEKQKKVGSILFLGNVSRDLYYARESRVDGKRQVILATTRPIPFMTANKRSKAVDYQLIFIRLTLNEDGSGEGTLAGGVEIEYDREKKTFSLENFGKEPIKLTDIKKI